MTNGADPQSAVRGFLQKTNRAARFSYPVKGLRPGRHVIQTPDGAHPHRPVTGLRYGLNAILTTLLRQPEFAVGTAVETEQLGTARPQPPLVVFVDGMDGYGRHAFAVVHALDAVSQESKQPVVGSN